MRGRIERWVFVSCTCTAFTAISLFFNDGNTRVANAQTGSQVKLVLQITIDGLRGEGDQIAPILFDTLKLTYGDSLRRSM